MLSNIKKKTKKQSYNMKFHVKISVWICILSFIISLLIYFGIIRYVKMYMNSNEKMIEKYMQHNEQSPDKTNVIVSLDVSNFSSEHMKPVINSLYDQTHSVSRIQINVPREIYNKHKNDIDDLKKSVFVNIIEKDYGDNTIIPTILFEKNNDTHVIRANDTIIYSKDFIELMLHHKVDGSIISLRNKPDVYIMDLSMIDSDLLQRQDESVLRYLKSKGFDIIEKHLPENYRNIF